MEEEEEEEAYEGDVGPWEMDPQVHALLASQRAEIERNFVSFGYVHGLEKSMSDAFQAHVENVCQMSNWAQWNFDQCNLEIDQVKDQLAALEQAKEHPTPETQGVGLKNCGSKLVRPAWWNSRPALSNGLLWLNCKPKGKMQTWMVSRKSWVNS